MRQFLLNIVDGLYARLDPPRDEVRGDPQYQYWRDDGKWFYALVAGNNEPMSASTQGYASRAAVLRAIGAEKRNSSMAQALGVDKPPRE